jgi:hypothetical protein
MRSLGAVQAARVGFWGARKAVGVLRVSKLRGRTDVSPHVAHCSEKDDDGVLIQAAGGQIRADGVAVAEPRRRRRRGGGGDRPSPGHAPCFDWADWGARAANGRDKAGPWGPRGLGVGPRSDGTSRTEPAVGPPVRTGHGHEYCRHVLPIVVLVRPCLSRGMAMPIAWRVSKCARASTSTRAARQTQ